MFVNPPLCGSSKHRIFKRVIHPWSIKLSSFGAYRSLELGTPLMGVSQRYCTSSRSRCLRAGKQQMKSTKYRNDEKQTDFKVRVTWMKEEGCDCPRFLYPVEW